MVPLFYALADLFGMSNMVRRKQALSLSCLLQEKRIEI